MGRPSNSCWGDCMREVRIQAVLDFIHSRVYSAIGDIGQVIRGFLKLHWKPIHPKWDKLGTSSEVWRPSSRPRWTMK